MEFEGIINGIKNALRRAFTRAGEEGSEKASKGLLSRVSSFTAYGLKKFFSKPKTLVGWASRGLLVGAVGEGIYKLSSGFHTQEPTTEDELADMSADIQGQILNRQVLDVLSIRTDDETAALVAKRAGMNLMALPGAEIRASALLLASEYITASRGSRLYNPDTAYRVLKRVAKTTAGLALGIPDSDESAADFRSEFSEIPGREIDFLIFYVDNTNGEELKKEEDKSKNPKT